MDKAIDRVFKILKERNLAPSMVERELSFSNGYLKKMLRTSGNLGEEALDKLSKYFDLSLNFLVRGEIEPQQINKTQELNPRLERELLEAYRKINQLQHEVEQLKNKETG